MVENIVGGVVVGLILPYILDMEPHLRIWFIVGGLILIYVIKLVKKKFIKKEYGNIDLKRTDHSETRYYNITKITIINNYYSKDKGND